METKVELSSGWHVWIAVEDRSLVVTLTDQHMMTFGFTMPMDDAADLGRALVAVVDGPSD